MKEGHGKPARFRAMLLRMRDRILIVGATGMLGAPVARRLIADGWRVRGLVRDPASARARFGDAIEWIAGDVTEPASLDAAFDGCALTKSFRRRGRNW